MIILHAAWFEGDLYLWGEKSSDSSGNRKVRSGRIGQPDPHPLDAGIKGLREALKAASAELPVSGKRVRALSAWLPTVENTPVPSSPLLGELPDPEIETTLHPWTVTARLLTFEEGRDFLCLCTGKRLLAKGVLPGTDLQWWTTGLRFAGALVTNQSYLPGLLKTEDGYEARWEPVLEGRDEAFREALSAGMPPSTRCLSLPDEAEPPETPPRVACDAFIASMLDRLVRDASNHEGRQRSGRRRKPSFESIHDAWLDALKSPDPSLEWEDPGSLDFLLQNLRRWQRPIRTVSQSPFRLCFRLEEPTDPAPMEEEDRWRVRYLVQPREDQSLMVPAEEVWDPEGPSFGMLQRYGKGLQEFLYASLGQASGLCPGVEGSLESEHPGGFETDGSGAYAFLRDYAPMLESAGFGLILPAWWTKSGAKTRLSLGAHVQSKDMQAERQLGLDNIVRFDWEIALGGQSLTAEELAALAAMKTPLVRFRGEWVELDAEQLRTAALFWEERQKEEASVRDVLLMALGAVERIEGLPFEGVRATGWIGDLLEHLEGRRPVEGLAPPDMLQGELRPYQVRGYSWLSFLRDWGLGACLADDMGLGKTIQTLALMANAREHGEVRPFLIICPTSVVNNWLREAETFTPRMDVLVHHGQDRIKDEAFTEAATKHFAVVSSYGLLHRDLKTLKGVQWAGVILDEAQNIKNPETKQSRAARSLDACFRVALTGTPVENHVGDLWALMDFLNPGLLGNRKHFKETFFNPIQSRGNRETAARLKRLTSPFVLRRLKTDTAIISDLPEKVETKVFCRLTREQATLYAAVIKEAEQTLAEAEDMQRRGLILSLLTRLKQVCNHPAHFLKDRSSTAGRSGKLERLEEILDEILESGERSLLFTQFTEMGEILKRHLQENFGLEALFLHGGVSRKQRDRMIERFQESDDAPLFFILSLKAGGTGLNLTRANHVFHVDRWWNPAVENQATDRAFRIGQTRSVQVHKFLCAGTLEERIDALIERKTAVADQVVGTGEAWLTELSNDELRDLILLGKDAVGD
ncbi:MAG: DEAD/DEAH box helicase [Desulfobacteraceae bacterium]|jgi:superfamily II DNA or RNA helicase